MAEALWLAWAVFLIAGGGAVLGGLVVAEARRAGVEVADAFDGYDADDIQVVDEPTVDLHATVELPRFWVVPDDRHKHTARDSRCRVPRYVLEPWDLYRTAEYPHLEAVS